MGNKYLFRQVRIADPGSPKNSKKLDVLVEGGRIAEMGRDIQAKATEINGAGALLYPGFCDLYADLGDPGFEHREDFESGKRAAAAGGFTAVCVIPRTHPVVQSKSGVEYVLHRSAGSAVDLLPLGAVSENLEGRQPTEMYDMHRAGAVGFTDAPLAVKSSGLLLRALQYVQPFNGIVMDMATDDSLANDGQVSEGEVSVRMGLKGVPHLAEVVQIKRNLEILRYTGGRLHLFGISTKEGVQLVRKAKAEGLDVTASVFQHHLLFTDEDVSGFDSNLKSRPPFRTEADRKALLRGLRDGVIDCVATQHTPLEVEEKKLEFEYATPGLTGLETTYAVVCAAFGQEAEAHRIAEWLSVNPRKLLGREPAAIEPGAPANFCLADPTATWTYSDKVRRSKSANSPLLGRQLTGRVLGIFNNGKWVPND